MRNLKFSFFFYVICISHFSCVRTQYINCGTNYLVNYPAWEWHRDIPALKDLMLRVDTLRRIGNLNRILGNESINFEFYQLCVAMNIEGGCRGGVSPSAEKLRKYRISYQKDEIKINLFVSDSLNDPVIKALKAESTDKNIEKGYLGKNTFLYINDYGNNSTVFVIINLDNKRAYIFQQDEQNLNDTWAGSVDNFLFDRYYYGVSFFANNTSFSLCSLMQ